MDTSTSQPGAPPQRAAPKTAPPGVPKKLGTWTWSNVGKLPGVNRVWKVQGYTHDPREAAQPGDLSGFYWFQT
ncbi:uncharacterized protein BKCO1_1100064 [Diplodia corticola]|uniref:Uncharacterized protein n=1 Tax=Diplodia corticola TaxID=236234 RepID=A0A1J9R8A8_9PEZI|nr:uncharacterized protein BKCO1_1100064 [Diplodia corticola]OJD36426.1 hypothetical protein BKCO1_1100064 [Diplodia corticola]